MQVNTYINTHGPYFTDQMTGLIISMLLMVDYHRINFLHWLKLSGPYNLLDVNESHISVVVHFHAGFTHLFCGQHNSLSS